MEVEDCSLPHTGKSAARHICADDSVEILALLLNDVAGEIYNSLLQFGEGGRQLCNGGDFVDC